MFNVKTLIICFFCNLITFINFSHLNNEFKKTAKYLKPVQNYKMQKHLN